MPVIRMMKADKDRAKAKHELHGRARIKAGYGKGGLQQRRIRATARANGGLGLRQRRLGDCDRLGKATGKALVGSLVEEGIFAVGGEGL